MFIISCCTYDMHKVKRRLLLLLLLLLLQLLLYNKITTGTLLFSFFFSFHFWSVLGFFWFFGTVSKDQADCDADLQARRRRQSVATPPGFQFHLAVYA